MSGRAQPAERVVVLADIGRESIHVGDEAIAAATTANLTGRGFEVVLQGQSEELVRRRHACSESLLAPDEAPTDDAPESAGHYRDRLSEVAADAILVAGGGNLSSAFPALLAERLQLLEEASRRGLPAGVSGQTYGPILINDDRRRLTDALAICRFTGTRDQQSDTLLTTLGLQPSPCLDDASFFALAPETDDRPTVRATPQRIVATFSDDCAALLGRNHAVQLLATALDQVAEHTSASISLVPHVFTIGTPTHDEAFHDEIAATTRSGQVTSERITGIEEAAAALDTTDLVISTRFHPVVFALARAVPFLALPIDHYGDARIDGVLRRWGLEGYAMPFGALNASDIGQAVHDIWAEHADLRQHLTKAYPLMRKFHQDWWDAAASQLRGLPSPFPNLPDLPLRQAPDAIRTRRSRGLALLASTGRADQNWLQLAALTNQLQQVSSRMAAEHDTLRADRDRLAQEVVTHQELQTQLQTELTALKDAWDQALAERDHLINRKLAGLSDPHSARGQTNAEIGRPSQ